MRTTELHFRELRIGDSAPIVVDLHRRISVVIVSDEDRRRMVAAIAAVAEGSAADGSAAEGFEPVGGVVVLDGEQVELEPGSPELYPVLGADALIVRRGDLPEPDRTTEIGTVQAAEDLVDARRQLFADGERSAGDSAESLEIATSELESAGSRLSEGRSASADEAAELDIVRQRVVALLEALAAVEESLADAEERETSVRALVNALADVLGAGEDRVRFRMGDRHGDLRSVLVGIVDLGGEPADTARELVEWLDGLAERTVSIDERSEELIASLAEVDGRTAVAVERGIDGDPDVIAATEHAVVLSHLRDQLEDLSGSGHLGESAFADIRLAHQAVADAKGSKKEAALAFEAEALANFGFDSYLDFTISASTRTAGQRVAARLDAVGPELAEAEAAVTASRDGAATRLRTLREDRGRLISEVESHLGFRPDDGDLESELSAIPRIPDVWEALELVLAAALEESTQALLEHRAALDALDSQVAEARGELSSWEERVRAAEERVAELEACWTDHRSRVEAAEARSAAAAEEAVEARASLSDAEARLRVCVDAAQAAGPTTGDLEALSRAIGSLAERNGPRWATLVLDDVLGDLEPAQAIEVLGGVARTDPAAQLIYLSGDRRLRRAAHALPSDTASVSVVRGSPWALRRRGRRSSATSTA